MCRQPKRRATTCARAVEAPGGRFVIRNSGDCGSRLEINARGQTELRRWKLIARAIIRPSCSASSALGESHGGRLLLRRRVGEGAGDEALDVAPVQPLEPHALVVRWTLRDSTFEVRHPVHLTNRSKRCTKAERSMLALRSVACQIEDLATPMQEATGEMDTWTARRPSRAMRSRHASHVGERGSLSMHLSEAACTGPSLQGHSPPHRPHPTPQPHPPARRA